MTSCECPMLDNAGRCVVCRRVPVTFSIEHHVSVIAVPRALLTGEAPLTDEAVASVVQTNMTRMARR